MPIMHAVAGRRRRAALAPLRLRRSAAAAGLFLGAALAIRPALAAGGGARPTPFPAAAQRTVEWVRFPDSRAPPVKVIRGSAVPSHAVSVEVVSFGGGRAGTVRVVRGLSTGGPAGRRGVPEPVSAKLLRLMGFDAGDLFSPDAAQLDRVTFAVDWVESRHGADRRMWRPEPLGPQGPMQVSAKAAFDVGGGNRFDLAENRLLGRAYLARMFRHYGNWPDALAAYNWGPGNLDQWIAAGRPADRLPDGVARYVASVLNDAVIAVLP